MEFSRKKLLAPVCVVVIVATIAGLVYFGSQGTGKGSPQENNVVENALARVSFNINSPEQENRIDNIRIVLPYPRVGEIIPSPRKFNWELGFSKSIENYPYVKNYLEMENGEENALMGHRTKPIKLTVLKRTAVLKRPYQADFPFLSLDIRIDRLYGRDNEENIIGEGIMMDFLVSVPENWRKELEYARIENERYVIYVSSTVGGVGFSYNLIPLDENLNPEGKPLDGLGLSRSTLENGSGWYLGTPKLQQEPPYNQYIEWSYMDPQPSKPVEYWSNNHE